MTDSPVVPAAQDKDKHPQGDPNRCSARKKVCSNTECKYRYLKGDKTWTCPQCGTDRQCGNKPIDGYKVCRMHGARGGRPPGSKYVIARKIQAAFNRIMQDPQIWELAEQQAVFGTRFEDLTSRLDDLENAGVNVAFMNNNLRALARICSREKINPGDAQAIIFDMRKHLEPAGREEHLWQQIIEMGEVLRRNSDSTKRWLRDNDNMVSMSELIEFLAFMVQVAFLFIPAPHDRKAYVGRIKEIMPRQQAQAASAADAIIDVE